MLMLLNYINMPFFKHCGMLNSLVKYLEINLLVYFLFYKNICRGFADLSVERCIVSYGKRTCIR